MHLNLPILDRLSSCQNILIAGMGGGLDVFCGLAERNLFLPAIGATETSHEAMRVFFSARRTLSARRYALH